MHRGTTSDIVDTTTTTGAAGGGEGRGDISARACDISNGDGYDDEERYNDLNSGRSGESTVQHGDGDAHNNYLLDHERAEEEPHH